MMVFHVNVANDVVVDDSVFAWTEVPRLLLRVIVSALKSRQLVVEVDNVVSLLVAKGTIL